jgi:hypothetical protein
MQYNRYLFLGLHEGRLMYKKPLALKREPVALQNMKFLHFCHFRFFVGLFPLLDPDPLSKSVPPDQNTSLRIRMTVENYVGKYRPKFR